ncbi:precorrin-2 C(20)-methyltransferase/precorrin-3B C(17)-methyltransferase, partial [Gordonia otitidis NBRC 100426]
SRTWQVPRLHEMLSEMVPSDRVMIIGRDVGGPEESVSVTTVGAFDPTVVDMRTMLIIGSSTTTVAERAAGRLVFTPRHHSG